MPLSEHEQRLLDQIERALYADDPKWADRVRSRDLKTHLVRRIRNCAVLLLVGLLILLTGVILPQPLVGVLGFLVMLAAGLVMARSTQRIGARRPEQPGPERQRSGRGKRRGSLLERIEERWKNRWDDRDR